MLSAATPIYAARPSACLTLPGFSPVDTYPIRSPLMAADFLAPLVAGKNFCEIGTRNGDIMSCVSHFAASVTAIEMDETYCTKLRERGYDDFKIVLNAEPAAARALVDALDLDENLEILCDPSGAAGRAFGVSRGWKPDDDEIRITDEFAIPLNAYGKLFGMLLGLGAWATLPAVIGGYVGNPLTPQPWIEDALAQGMRKDRFPGNALDLDASGAVTSNKFKELPGVGSWPRPPLELATLRLQNMVGISLANWDALKPDNLATLTQLGGCVLSDGNGGVAYEWTDPGICAVANFEEILKALDAPAKDDAAVEALAA